MNREILFRGKRVYNGEWVYGLIYYTMMGEICIIVFSDDFSFKVIPETVGQFTGLTDKNGNKIFEGDIVTNSVFSRKNYLVKFYKGGFVLSESESCLRIDHCSNIEIIGNIYDNDKI